MKAVDSLAKPHDLLVIPQAKIVQPAPHLTPQQAAKATQAWRNYGNTPNPSFEQTWTIAIAHIVDGDLQVTTTMRIPA
jgi:hypothetical protein